MIPAKLQKISTHSVKHKDSSCCMPMNGNARVCLACASGMRCRYDYNKDTNRVYQKVVAEIQLASPGSPGVSQVWSAMCLLWTMLLKMSGPLPVRPMCKGCKGFTPTPCQHTT